MQILINDEENKFLVVKTKETNKNKLLKELASKLHNEEYVKESYIKAVCDREEIFPTGLNTQGIGVAIPHTDSVHVNEKSMIVGILEEDVKFTIMGSDDELVDVGLVFMLAIKDPANQLTMLQNLIELCQDESHLKELKDGCNVNKINNIIANLI